MDEFAQRYSHLIKNFKAYDKRRQEYLRGLEKEHEQLKMAHSELKSKAGELEMENHRLKEQIEVLLEVINNAKPLISNPKQKAYLFGLITKATQNKINQKKVERIPLLEAEIKDLKELVKALKQNIHNLHCGLPKIPINNNQSNKK